MDDILEYLSSDEYKINVFKESLKHKIEELKSCLGMSSYYTDDFAYLEILVNKLGVLYNNTNKKSKVNEIILNLISLEREILLQIAEYENSYVRLENILHFILDEKVDLLIDNKAALSLILDLASSIRSNNGNLKVAGDIVINELNDNQKTKSIKNMIENASYNVSRYSSALQTVSSYNKDKSGYSTSEIAELSKFNKRLTDIIDNYIY